VSLYDVLLFLHVVGGFVLMGAITLFSIVVVATWKAQRPSEIVEFAGITRVGGLLVMVGTLMTVVFGLWLAIELDEYHLWEGWVLAAIVLWAIGSEAGRRSASSYGRMGAEAARLARAGDSARPEPRRAKSQRSGPRDAPCRDLRGGAHPRGHDLETRNLSHSGHDPP
jgi:uncharacterized membrane protein